MKRLRKNSGEYQLKIPYQSDEELDNTIYEILHEAGSIAELRNCFVEGGAHCVDDPDRNWLP
jgi:hypothetical protein